MALTETGFSYLRWEGLKLSARHPLVRVSAGQAMKNRAICGRARLETAPSTRAEE